MDIKNHLESEDPAREFSEPQGLDPLELQFTKERLKTSLRMNYEAQVSRIQRQIGDLEVVRKTLGLSQRKMCQLLLVDPSAWSRWTKKSDPNEPGSAPPHVWRALQWYMALHEKIPGLNESYFLGTFPETAVSSFCKKERERTEKTLVEIQELSRLQRRYEGDLRRLKRRIYVLYGFLGASGVLGLLFIFLKL